MNHKRGNSSWMAVLLLAGLASVGIAQNMPDAARGARAGGGGLGFASTLEHKVGLSPEQRDAVRGLLAEQRQKSQALREETDTKIRALLNPEQRKKFDDVLSEQKARRGKPKA